MGLKEDLKKYGHYLNTDPELEIDLVALLLDSLDPGTFSAVEAKLSVILDGAKGMHYTVVEKAIRDLANELPENNKLRKAIELVP